MILNVPGSAGLGIVRKRAALAARRRAARRLHRPRRGAGARRRGELAPIVSQAQDSGVTSLRGVAAVLHARGVRRAATQVGAALRRPD